MPIKRYNGTDWEVVAGAGVQGATGASGNTTVNSKGDLLTFDTAAARLPVGANGETLVADSSTSTGLRYQGSQAAGKNAIINGAFDIWQRSTSAAINAGSYVAGDRWYTYRNTTGSTFSRQSASLTGFQYSGRIARDSGNTATASISVGQSIESVNSIPYAGQTIVFSFWAKAGANFSATSNILRARLLSSTTENQNIVLYGGTTVIDQNVTLTTSWQRFTYSAAVGSTAVTLGTIFSYDPTGTAGAADNFEITGVQVELGSVATAFTRAGGTIQGELAACQRYFETINTATSRLMSTGGYVQTTSVARFTVPVVQKRTTPTVTITGTLNVIYSTGSEATLSSISELDSNTSGNLLTFRYNTSGTPLTSGQACGLYASGGAVTFGISAEL